MSTASSAYKDIEDIEAQLDVCARRIRELEDHVRSEIERHEEDVRKLRSQLRRTIEAISEARLSAADGEPDPAADPAAPDAYADLLPESPMPDALPTFAYEEDRSFADPFESFLGGASEEPEPVAEELVVEDAVAEIDAEIDEAIAEEPEADVPPGAGMVSDPQNSVGPFDVEALSGFVVPTEAFLSERPPDPTPNPVQDPFADVFTSADEEAYEESAEQPSALSEFNMMLDWSDFEPEELAENNPPIHSGDGVTAAPVPPPPALQSDRPVFITKGVSAANKTAVGKAPDEITFTRALDEARSDDRDLTLIAGIDDAMQASLNRLGVTTLDEIAGWHRADAARIAALLGSVSENEIFDRWVLEAQAALFDLFQQRLRRSRSYGRNGR